MREVNRTYREKDCATDVLSFGYPGEKSEGLPFLGEIVIAPEIAQKHAVQYQESLDSEIRRLLVHGLLHLLGYDHETDQGDMKRLQTRLLRRRGLSADLFLIKARSER